MSHDNKQQSPDILSILEEDDPDLQFVFRGLNEKWTRMKEQLAQQQSDLAAQDEKIDELEKDSLQQQELAQRMTEHEQSLKTQIQLLQSQLDEVREDKKLLENVEKSNGKLRKLNEELFEERINLKIQNDELKDLLWEFFAGYNALIDDVTERCARPDTTGDILTKLSEAVQHRNEGIVKSAIGDLNGWCQTNNTSASSMALLFNQEQRRIALRERFKKAHFARKMLF